MKKTAEEIYNNKAHYNKCMNEFTQYEKDCVLDCINEALTASQSQWVKCSERLPEENGRYLINDNGHEIALFVNGKWKSIGKEQRGVLSDFRADLYPTHWQPLPPLPEEE